jgi:hypothetical protein
MKEHSTDITPIAMLGLAGFFIAFTICFAIHAYNKRIEKYVDAGFVEVWKAGEGHVWVKP